MYQTHSLKPISVQRTRPRVILLLVSSWIALALLGCSIGPIGDEASEVQGQPAEDMDTIVVGLPEIPTSLDPADHLSRVSETVIRNMFDGLVTRDQNNKVVLELAEEFNWVDDQTLEVKLREGVLFHDGSEMTADDVVFSFNRIIVDNAIEFPEPHTSPRQSLLAPLELVEKIDPYTVLFHFSSPWPPAMQLLVHQQILPMHVLEEVGTEGFLEHPIGTGPFRFISSDQKLTEIVLERFDSYYGGSPALPPVGTACVDRVIFLAIPDAGTRVAALRVGEADIIQAVPIDVADRLISDPEINIMTAPGTQPLWLEMNIKHPFFFDENVRQALNYAIDKNKIIAEVYGSRAEPLAGPLSPNNPFVHDELTPYPYDIELAKAMLEKAGWKERRFIFDESEASIPEGDELIDVGILRDSQGIPFQFNLDTLPEWYPLAAELSAQLRMIGILADIRLWEPEDIRPEHNLGNRDAYLDDWGDSAFDPVGHFDAKWHGYSEEGTYGQANFSGFNDPRVNELIRAGEITAEESERRAIYYEAQEIIYKKAPAIFLVLPEIVEAASVKVVNWEPASDGSIMLHDVCIQP